MHTVGDATSSVPAFLGKLWKLVEDPSTNHLISWNSVRRPFVIVSFFILAAKVTCLQFIVSSCLLGKFLLVQHFAQLLLLMISILTRMG